MTRVSSLTVVGYWVIGIAFVTILVGAAQLQSTRKKVREIRDNTNITPWGSAKRESVPPLTPFPPEEPLDLYRKWLPDYNNNRTEGLVKLSDVEVKYKVVSSEKPRALLIENIINTTEAELLMSLANGKLKRSQVVSNNGGGRIGSVRTSEGTFLTNEDPAVKVIRRRIASLAHVPVGHLERIQILRYESGQYYKLHPDFFSGAKLKRLGKAGQRMATCLMWLTNVTTGGGETVFSNAQPVISLSPRPLSGVLFYSLDRNGVEDKTSLHQSTEITGDSVKWVAVIWIRIGFMN
eukprot:TRINITY_DN1259_c0_g1_i1.p1 TRINITY_DN1259_c0_g1~~TRINITY_DN1259_c0_g1_i1.p1  ORF type:complete len:293 (+),score=35.33 TRINITY_DN1259_c0_g1_i1:44-922(+)